MISIDSSEMGDEEEEEEEASCKIKDTRPLISTEQIILFYLLFLLTVLFLVVFFSFFNLRNPTISLENMCIDNSTNKFSISFCFSVINPSTVAVLRCQKNSMVVQFFSKVLSRGVLITIPGEIYAVEAGTKKVVCMEKVGLSHFSFSAGDGDGPVGLVQVGSSARLDAKLEVFGFVSLSVRAYAYCWSAFDVFNGAVHGASVAISCTSY